MEVETVLVTGANRGIGLEFVRQLVQLSKPPLYLCLLLTEMRLRYRQTALADDGAVAPMQKKKCVHNSNFQCHRGLLDYPSDYRIREVRFETRQENQKLPSTPSFSQQPRGGPRPPWGCCENEEEEYISSFGTYQALKEIKDASKETEIHLIKLDVSKTDEIENARKTVAEVVGDRGLNLLINNAGAARWLGFPDITEEDMVFHFKTNTVGPVIVFKEMLPLLQISAKHKSTGVDVSKTIVLNISSTAGSIAVLTDTNPLWREYLSVMGYRISKTALNMAMRVAALSVKDEGILVVNMCPGWVKTDMGTDRAMIEVSESVSDMMKMLPQLNVTHQGAFLDRHGNTILIKEEYLLIPFMISLQ
ncbi:c-factor [Caerostris extrusa]|uniref:C-factor n=1 Tax=Caerostris extrusa TaxID=172846 RepID=A0AAV4UQG8_CAEEX|nr:c-factor [Caerostris extrusa]